MRRKNPTDQSDTKANYVFATGQVGIFAMMLSIARGTLGVRAFLGKFNYHFAHSDRIQSTFVIAKLKSLLYDSEIHMKYSKTAATLQSLSFVSIS